jgi:hypothetical protein
MWEILPWPAITTFGQLCISLRGWICNSVSLWFMQPSFIRIAFCTNICKIFIHFSTWEKCYMRHWLFRVPSMLWNPKNSVAIDATGCSSQKLKKEKSYIYIYIYIYSSYSVIRDKFQKANEREFGTKSNFYVLQSLLKGKTENPENIYIYIL